MARIDSVPNLFFFLPCLSFPPACFARCKSNTVQYSKGWNGRDGGDADEAQQRETEQTSAARASPVRREGSGAGAQFFSAAVCSLASHTPTERKQGGAPLHAAMARGEREILDVP